MAEAIIGPLVGRLQEVAVGEARVLVGVNTDIHRLRDKLMWLQAFLREADTRRRSVSDEITRVWTQQTRDAVFDAEDALDHYHLRVDKSRCFFYSPKRFPTVPKVGSSYYEMCDNIHNTSTDET
ncbi:hypothetical protein C2845_PM05G17260 [Panicum miliaceum]|uniref:Disease resistance N-terminal domain-containing protein n=1 Tax=Panicum miliaceum TaxID=4540 RepID=A0A3L6T2Y7_PANMI|nr:hypothetical protein C2845_PM05G17260 [Panicum miliaceum]